MLRALVLFAFLLPGLAFAQAESDDGRPWLDSPGPDSSPLAAASRANALNKNAAAEKLLREIIGRPRSPETHEAHKLLSRIYVRTGRYKRATENLAAWLRAFPDSADAQAEARDLIPFRGLPDQKNGRRVASVLKHEDDLWLPLSVNGKPSTFLVDTGAWVSIVTQKAAERLGLEFRGSGGAIGDSSGKGVATKTAVAKELVVGKMRFQNVSFFVIPDQEPFASLPVEQRGILGMPIQLGIGTWQWSKFGTSRLGEKLPLKGTPNLVFFRNKGLVAVEIGGQRAFLTLDSGATSTDLNGTFAVTFASLLTNASKTTREITGLGGTSTFDAYVLPELNLSVGGRALTLRLADVTLQELAGVGGECCVGNFGNDLLTQADGFSLDFDHMSLQFR